MIINKEGSFVIVTKIAKKLHLDLNEIFDIDSDKALLNETEE